MEEVELVYNCKTSDGFKANENYSILPMKKVPQNFGESYCFEVERSRNNDLLNYKILFEIIKFKRAQKNVNFFWLMSIVNHYNFTYIVNNIC